jgi:hypothetical protein
VAFGWVKPGTFQPISLERFQTVMTRWRSFLREARAKTPADATPTPPEELLGSSKKLLGSSEELLGSAKELLGSSDELTGSSEELLGSPEELTGSPEELLGSSKELLGSSEELLGSPRESAFCKPFLCLDSALSPKSPPPVANRRERRGQSVSRPGNRIALSGRLLRTQPRPEGRSDHAPLR